MAWITRNLFFVITVAIGLAVTGYCGFLLFEALRDNKGVSEEYGTTVTSLKDLQKNPNLNQESIATAKADQERAKAFLQDFRKAFAPVPTPPTVNEEGFKEYIQKQILELGVAATNSGVMLPPDYEFTFGVQRNRLSYSSECIGPWMQQLEEIKAIMRVLCAAKINYLVGLQRVSVCNDDFMGGDFLAATTVSNQTGVVTPYVISFRGFSPEVAAVLAGFAGSSNCFIVKDIDVKQSSEAIPILAPASDDEGPVPVPGVPSRPNPPGRLRRQMGAGDDYRPPQQVQAPVVVVASAPQVILAESLLFVTVAVDVVRLK